MSFASQSPSASPPDLLLLNDAVLVAVQLWLRRVPFYIVLPRLSGLIHNKLRVCRGIRFVEGFQGIGFTNVSNLADDAYLFHQN